METTQKQRKLNASAIINNKEQKLVFREKMNKAMKQMNISEETDTNTHWNILKTQLMQVAENTLGYEMKQKHNDWFDEECKKAVSDRNEARNRLLQRKTRTKQQEYEEKRKIAKNICRRKKTRTRK